MFGSIVLIEDGRIRAAIGDSLPAAYRDALVGRPIGPRAGSCGTAAYSGQRVVVEDIETDDLWSDYRDLRKTNSRISRRSGGPTRGAYVQCFATKRRCQRSSVAGVTMKDRHRARGRRRLPATRKNRSIRRSNAPLVIRSMALRSTRIPLFAQRLPDGRRV
jgi:hypothetical protein